MAIEYLRFENPESLAIGVFIALFTISFMVLIKPFKQRGITLIISLAISAIASWYLYKERFYGFEDSLAIILFIVVIAVFLKILWPFVKNLKKIFVK